jgi:hypothetical protein
MFRCLVEQSFVALIFCQCDSLVIPTRSSGGLALIGTAFREVYESARHRIEVSALLELLASGVVVPFLTEFEALVEEHGGGSGVSWLRRAPSDIAGLRLRKTIVGRHENKAPQETCSSGFVIIGHRLFVE